MSVHVIQLCSKEALERAKGANNHLFQMSIDKYAFITCYVSVEIKTLIFAGDAGRRYYCMLMKLTDWQLRNRGPSIAKISNTELLNM